MTEAMTRTQLKRDLERALDRYAMLDRRFDLAQEFQLDDIKEEIRLGLEKRLSCIMQLRAEYERLA